MKHRRIDPLSSPHFQLQLVQCYLPYGLNVQNTPYSIRIFTLIQRGIFSDPVELWIPTSLLFACTPRIFAQALIIHIRSLQGWIQ